MRKMSTPLEKTTVLLKPTPEPVDVLLARIRVLCFESGYSVSVFEPNIYSNNRDLYQFEIKARN
jgi:hypothetical protein